MTADVISRRHHVTPSSGKVHERNYAVVLISVILSWRVAYIPASGDREVDTPKVPGKYIYTPLYQLQCTVEV